MMDGKFKPLVILLSPSMSGLAASFDSKSRRKIMKRVTMLGHVMLFERQISSTLSVDVYTSRWRPCIGSSFSRFQVEADEDGETTATRAEMLKVSALLGNSGCKTMPSIMHVSGIPRTTR